MIAKSRRAATVRAVCAVALVAAAASARVGPAQRAAPVLLDDFGDIAVWQHNRDGGVVSEVTRDTDYVRSQPSAMRVRYRDAPPHWSNLTRDLEFPDEWRANRPAAWWQRGALDLWVYKHDSALGAALHVWLFESDGDGWVAALKSEGLILGRLARGWHHFRVRLSDLRYEPRGDKKPDLPGVSRMLLGCNFGDLEVTFDDLRFVPAEDQPEEPGLRRLDDGLVEERAVRLDAADPVNTHLLGDGWWQLEPGSTWTGRGRAPAEVVFEAEAGRDYLVTFADVTARPDIIPDYEVTLLCNGRVLATERPRQPRTEFRLLLPAGEIPPGEAKIALRAPLYVPREVGEGPDDRTLGVKVGKIRIASYARTKVESERTTKGSIGVLKDELPPAGASSDPDYLARLLRRAGYGVTFLKAQDLLSPPLLTKQNFDLLVLPYGASYPAHGRDALVAYLSEGGSFLSLGGYAFDNPLVFSGGRWVGPAAAGLPAPAGLVDIGSEGDEERLLGKWLAGEAGGGEWNDQASVRKRWTAGRAGVRVPVPEGENLVLKVSMAYRDPAWYAANATRRMPITGTVVLGGEPVGTFEGESGAAVLEYEVPPEAIAGGDEVEVWIDTSLWSPGEISASPDRQRRGIAVNWVALVPRDAVQEAPPASEFDVRINTRYGRTGDSLGLEATQIGVFDPSYPLRHASVLAPAPLFADGEQWELKGAFEGWGASSLAASNSPVFPELYGVRIPVLEAFDDYGRPRGAAGALVYNHSGPFAGSRWAFFGVTNRDVFAPGDRRMGRLFVDLVDRMLRGVFIESVRTDLACYRPEAGDELVSAAVEVRNLGGQTAQVTVELAVGGEERHAPWRRSVSVAAGEAVAVRREIKLGDLPAKGLHKLTATLRRKGRRGPLDARDAAFVVWDDEAARGGTPLRWQDSYFRRGDRQEFLLGTNQTGMMFYSADENPLVWDRDFRQMADHNVQVLRILHFSPFVKEGDPKPATSPLQLAKGMPQKLARQLDAIVQLCQKHEIILFLSVHDWMGVDLTDAELAAQREFARQIAERYRGVPGIIIDVQNEPSVRPGDAEHVRGLWNEYLAGQYDNVVALREAWGEEAPAEELGDIPVATGGDDWSSIKSVDYSRFRALVLNRWVRENIAGVKEGDPRRLATVGYLPSMWPADKVLGQQYTDFSNMHYYGHGSNFPREFFITDRRFEGKGLSIGEFGAKVHPTWGASSDPDAFVGVTMRQAERWFLRLAHYTLGLGGAMICNWDWKDMTGCVFPWGIVHPHDAVPKDQLLAFRNIGELFRRFEFAYRPPQVYVLVPDSHRMGASERAVTNAAQNLIDRLLSLHVQFGIINEWDLEKLPEEARVLLWPVPFCPTDQTYEQVKAFVQQGGRLYVSGDLSYDQHRQRLRTERLEELCGVRFVAERCPNIRWDSASALQPPANVRIAGYFPGRACIKVEPTTGEALLSADDGTPVVLRNRVGRGEVLYYPDPLELHSDDSHLFIYRQFLDQAEVERPSVTPDDPNLHASRLPLEGGGEAWVLFNNADKALTVTLDARRGKVRLQLASKGPGFVAVGPAGQLLAIEAQGHASYADEQVVSADGHFYLLSADDRDLRDTGNLEVCAFDDVTLQAPCLGGKTAEMGERVDGDWRCYERERIGRNGKLELRGLRRLCLVRVTPN